MKAKQAMPTSSDDPPLEGPLVRQRQTRVKTGCLTCRQRKKKCDRDRPRCGHCERLNLMCRWEDPRDPLIRRPGRVKHQGLALVKAPNPSKFWISVDSNDASSISSQRAVLRYYMETFTLTLTTNTENNGFLSVLLPMATESGSTRDALLAWAASHLALSQPSYEPLALQSRSKALQSLCTTLSEGGEQREQPLAACLALCSMEAILGDKNNWYQHLMGASTLINAAASSAVRKGAEDGVAAIGTTFEGRWLLRNFAYHDILMSVTLDQAPLITGSYWMSHEEKLVDSYFGLATVPMQALSEISSINAQLTPVHKLVMTLAQQQQKPTILLSQQHADRLSVIEDFLISWTCPPTNDISLKQLAETYRHAALIHLYRVQRKHNLESLSVLHSKLSDQVCSIINSVDQMAAECLPECTLLFPLFMAGGETTDYDQVEFIRKRLIEMERFRRFQNVKAALEVLEELWGHNCQLVVEENDDENDDDADDGYGGKQEDDGNDDVDYDYDDDVTMNETRGSSRCRSLPPTRTIDWIDVLKKRNWKLAIS